MITQISFNLLMIQSRGGQSGKARTPNGGGERRQFERKSGTLPDSQKKVESGWGADEGEAELNGMFLYVVIFPVPANVQPNSKARRMLRTRRTLLRLLPLKELMVDGVPPRARLL